MKHIFDCVEKVGSRDLGVSILKRKERHISLRKTPSLKPKNFRFQHLGAIAMCTAQQGTMIVF